MTWYLGTDGVVLPAGDLPASSGARSTRWSLIRELNAGHADSLTQFYELCVRYWAPIQNYVRGLGYSEESARSLCNEFFEHLQRDALSRAHSHRRFREFLQEELDSFLAGNKRSPTIAGGHAGGLRHSFALEVIGHAMTRLRGEAIEADRLAMFERLERYLASEAKPADIERDAGALGAKTLFVTMAIRQLRLRFRRLVDDELARLVTDQEELEEEREAMLGALGISRAQRAP